jgi:hypothetical protein
MKYWEMIADKLSASGWSWSCVSTVDSKRRTIFVAAQMPNERVRGFGVFKLATKLVRYLVEYPGLKFGR